MCTDSDWAYLDGQDGLTVGADLYMYIYICVCTDSDWAYLDGQDGLTVGADLYMYICMCVY